jgi:NAD(P)-dependent dehydrogenase (short-subunit alcohol dehydrogenase family)
MTNNSSVWFVTGASKGIGQVLAGALLADGHRVAATSRDKVALEKSFAGVDGLLALETDLTDAASVKAAINATVERFGSIDVVVNNAGYGQQGTVEALSDAEYRRNFDVNVFAPLHVLRFALPHMRRQRSGHIVNIASIVGIQGGYAGWSSYVATKFALAGLTESLAAEVAELGIKATVVYPGPVRTDFLSTGSLAVAEHSIDEYTEAKASLDLHLNQLDGKQAGDPEAATEPPLHLFAGKIANQLAEAKIAGIRKDLNAWRETSAATDFPEE